MKNNFPLIFFFVISHFCFSQNQEETVNAIVSDVTREFSDVGLVIGIYNEFGTHYYSYGTRTIGSNQKLDSLSLFEIGSATKTFTALLLAQEIANKKIKLHDFIDQYLPKGVNLPCSLAEKIKMTDLASHQSGLPNLSNDKYFKRLIKRDPTNPFRFVDKDYLYEVLDSTDYLQDFRRYQYNNYAFSLLGALLEEKAQKSYISLINELILEPLKMSSTSFEIPQAANVAGLYNQDGQEQVYMIIDAANPAGGLKSNAVDLIKFLRAHLQNDQLAEAVELTQMTSYEDRNKRIGLGWEIGNNFFQKDGDTFGNSSFIRYSPKNNTAIVILSNHQNGQLVRDLMNGIYNNIIIPSTEQKSTF